MREFLERGPRSGIDFQIISSIGPLYSSRMWNFVSPLLAGVRTNRGGWDGTLPHYIAACAR